MITCKGFKSGARNQVSSNTFGLKANIWDQAKTITINQPKFWHYKTHCVLTIKAVLKDKREGM